jgi:hypothetical protein
MRNPLLDSKFRNSSNSLMKDMKAKVGLKSSSSSFSSKFREKHIDENVNLKNKKETKKKEEIDRLSKSFKKVGELTVQQLLNII